MQFSLEFILLFGVATAVAVTARRLKIPYTVALVVTGLVLGNAYELEVHLTQELLYAVFLPGLLFEAAFHLEWKKFWRNKLVIHSMAVPGLIVAMLLTAAILVSEANASDFVSGFTFMHGLVFASLIAATDPIAVVGLFKSLGAPKRLAVLVEGESLFNDGTAVVIFTLVVAGVTSGSLALGGAVLDFLRIVGIGLAIGGLFGFAVSQIIQRVDDPMVEITLTVIAAYGSFVVAEHFHFSGVIATVTAGMMCGNYAVRTGMQPTTRVAVETFWEYVAFALNSIVFLLIGFEVGIEMLVASWKPILAGYIAVMLARGAVVFGVAGLLRRTREKLSWSWTTVLWWAGLRGGLSMVLVLGLPADFPHRELLLSMTCGVVVISLLGQGLTMSPLLRRFGMASVAPDRHPYERERGRLLAARAALHEIDVLRQEHGTHRDVLDSLRNAYRTRVDRAQTTMGALHESQAAFRHEEELAARRHLLVVEKNALHEAFRQGAIGEEVFAELSGNLDRDLTALDDEDGEAARESR
jgi:CPA1 family monovalent cation:H+ antiporter